MAKDSGGESGGGKKYYWLIYLAVLVAGVLLIADAVHFRPIVKIPARLGIALIYSALAFMAAGSKAPAIIGTILVWAAVLLMFFV